MPDDAWPALSYEEWKDTYATVHMWSQIVGKITLALAPPLNHSWGITMAVTSRGLTTPLLPHGGRAFAIEFDFVAHRMVVRIVEGDERALPLTPKCVADFYRDVMALLDEMRLPVTIWTMPVEIPSP
ncbi:MAG TPA: DUF5996 family protein, partial [Vicinamibacterales bacterium]|nr:DUF5996 family protein [Vicinamibacterales bacterium]